MSRKVTMQQIADYLGVSTFVVSRALSGKDGVKKETQERVFQAASRLGYFTQKGIDPTLEIKDEALDEQKEKKSVLVVMPNIRNQLKESIYWGPIIDGISEGLERENLGMVILTESNSDSISSVLNPNGFLGLIGVGQISTQIILEVQRIGIPVILIDHEDKLCPTDSVFANNFDSSYLLTNYLIGLGHKRIHFIGNITYSSSFLDRWLGFRTALEENDLNVLNEDAELLKGESDDEMFNEVRDMLLKIGNEKSSLPTALFCANDAMAKHVYSVLEELDIKVPDDISVTGFDNIEDSHLLKPTLTTIDVPKEELGKRAVRALFNRINHSNSPNEKITVSSEILLRDSVLSLNNK